MKRKCSTKEPVRKSRRLQGENPDIWMPHHFQPSNSPLLNLPGEIRNKIWEMVLGNQTVHVDGRHEKSDTKPPDDKPLHVYHSICTSEYSETKAYQMATSTDPDKEYFHGNSALSAKWAPKINEFLRSRHHSCEDDEGSEKLTFGLLGVSRQIYAETRQIPYATNTWAFRSPKTFKGFLDIVPPSRRNRIKSIALEVDWNDDCERSRYFHWNPQQAMAFGPSVDDEWNRLMTHKLIDRLKGLKTLHLQFQEDFKRLLSFKNATIDRGFVAESISLFAKLPLETVRVIITSSGGDINAEHKEECEECDQTFSLSWRQKVAQSVESLLLRDRTDPMNGKLDEVLGLGYPLSTTVWEMFKRRIRREDDCGE